VPGGRQRPRHGCLDRLHPVLELALLECDLAEAGERLEDLLLTGGLEILRNSPPELCFVLRDEPGHAVKLLDPPRIAPRHSRREMPLLPVQQILERIHGRRSSERGITTAGRPMPPAFTIITSGAASGSVF
jgi:hypothetical protein